MGPDGASSLPAGRAGDRLLIQKTAAAEKTAGGILLPEAAKEAPVTGKVVAVGSGRVEEDGTVKVRHPALKLLASFLRPRPVARPKLTLLPPPTPPARPRVRPQKPEVEVSATVLYSKYSGVDFSGKDGEYVVVRAPDAPPLALPPRRCVCSRQRGDPTVPIVFDVLPPEQTLLECPADRSARTIFSSPSPKHRRGLCVAACVGWCGSCAGGGGNDRPSWAGSLACCERSASRPQRARTMIRYNI